MPVRFTYHFKLTVIFLSLIFTILLVTVSYVYRKAIEQQKEELRYKILSLAKLSSMLIDADKHSQIKPELASQDTELYKQIQAVLKKIQGSDPMLDSIYTMVKTGKKNIWMFVVDSGDKKGITAECGELYDVSEFPEMQLAFDKPSVDKEPSSDKWGMWLSSYAPIYNRKGETVAIVGLDVSTRSIEQMHAALTRRFILVLIIGGISSLLTGWFVAKGITRPLFQIINGTKEVQRGNYNQKIFIKSRDEMQDLAEAFNKMTDGLKESEIKLQKLYLNTIKTLAQTIDAKDAYTKGHSDRVTRYALGIAKELGVCAGDIKLLEDVCLLHDIGKIGVPEAVLTKPGPLSEEEWQIIKKHPAIGEEILRPIEFLKPGLSIVLNHHERPDGKGYPQGLKENEIPLLAAIVAVADAFDAMTTNRPYRQSLGYDKAIAILKENKGAQFNSRAVDAFIKYLSEQKDLG